MLEFETLEPILHMYDRELHHRNLVHFDNKNSFFYICKNAIAYYNVGVVVVKSSF
jgi:hypothetical protein